MHVASKLSARHVLAVAGAAVLSIAALAVYADAAPTVTLTSDHTSSFSGEQVNLTWTTNNATSCTASGAWSGSRSTGNWVQGVAPTNFGSSPKTYEYDISCQNSVGQVANASVILTVKPNVPVPLTFSANPTTVQVGQSSTLTWSAPQATDCHARGNWYGDYGNSGSATVTPAYEASWGYVIYCYNSTGYGSQSVVVTATNSAPPPPSCSGPNCVCAADTNHNGTVEQNEVATCDSYNGQSLCPLQRQACTVTSSGGHTCPSDSTKGCVDTGGGNFYCSPNDCADKAAQVTDSHDINQQQAQNDSQDASGKCNGVIRIFPGNGSRCRTAGTQSVWQNCCTNKMPKLQDTMGAPGDPTQNNYKKQKSKIEFWANQCDIQDQTTALLADSGYCVFLGNFCAEKWAVVGCVQQDQSYCCFNSQLSRIIQEQGRAQIPGMGGFGTPEAPNCRGFTPEEFQSIDFSKIDFSAYYSTLRYSTETKMQQGVQNNVNNYQPPGH